MDLLEYIRKNFPTPNTAVLRRLGASERLIDYLKHTSLNTNFNIVPQLIDSGGGEEELVAKGYDGFICYYENGAIEEDGDIVSHIGFNELKDIYDNHNDYQAFVKFGEDEYEMPWKTEEDHSSFWIDIYKDGNSYTAYISFGEEEWEGQMIWGVSIGVENMNQTTYEPVHILTKIYVKRKA